MGLFEKIFKPIKSDIAVKGYFSTFNAYNPTFLSRSGGIYEMDTTRAAVHAVATHCSKLKAHVIGSANKTLEKKLQYKPNPWQTASQFQYRLATILEVENTAFLVPVLDSFGRTQGVYALDPMQVTIVEGVDGITYLRYQFQNGKYAAVEYSRCGVMTKMQFKNDFFGESNAAINPTMDLMCIQNQGIQEGIKQSAALRFMAKLAQTIRPEDLEAEQQRFKGLNLAASNNGGVLIYDTKYADVKQIDSKPYVVDADQMRIINENVYNYFGVSEKILRNEYDENTWNAFYEGKVEPFALQLSLVLTSMFFSDREVANGNEVTYSANRLQLATIDKKVNLIMQMFDRGMLTMNEGREIMQMSPVDDGDVRMIRGEYVNTSKKVDDSGNANEDVTGNTNDSTEEVNPDEQEGNKSI